MEDPYPQSLSEGRMGWILLQRIVGWIRAKRTLVRQRKDDQLKALAVLLYYLALSCRTTREILREWEDVSHEATLYSRESSAIVPRRSRGPSEEPVREYMDRAIRAREGL